MSCEQLKNIPRIKSVLSFAVNRLSPADFQQTLGDQPTMAKLYPEGVIAVGYNIFEPHPSNAHFITYLHDNVFLSADKKAISIGGRFPCNDEKSWRYNFNYSGIVDLNSCMSHLAEHLKLYASEMDGKDMFLIVILSKSFKNLFGSETISYYLQELLFVEKKDVTLRMQYQYEFV